MDLIYTVEKASNVLGLTKETIRKILREKKLKGYKRLNRWYILHSDILDFVKLD